MTDAPPPNVTVIVCTRNQPEGYRRALASVMAQEPPGLDGVAVEVVVVDDGSDPPVELPAAVRFPIRLVRLDNAGAGAARAAGLDAARGALIAYCDDDSVWTSNHLRTLLMALRAEPEVALVFGEATWEPPAARPDQAPAEDASQLEAGHDISATDALHHADAARAVGGFDPHMAALADWDLWLRLSRAHRLRRVNAIVSIHRPRTSDVPLAAAAEARARIAEELRWRRNREELSAMVRARSEPLPFDPATWTPARRHLLVQASLEETLSFGLVGRYLLLALEAEGIEPVVGPLRDRPPAGFERFYGPVPRRTRLALHNDYLVGPSATGCERLAYYWMHESTLVPPDRVAEINRHVALLYVPCRQNAEAFAACGVRAPIRVLPHGVDAARFPYLERPRRDVFTFGTFGDLTVRKGIDVLLRAFVREFGPHEPVRLLVKRTRAEHEPPWPVGPDPRIELRTGFLDQAGLLEFLREMDAFVLPSRGEGFGLCGLEAMATGLPTVATSWGGPADYLDPADSLPLGYRLTDARGAWAVGTRFFGQWAEPDEEHLRSLLRWLYEHPAEAAAMGRQAAARVHAEWTWTRVGRKLRADFDALAQGVSPV